MKIKGTDSVYFGIRKKDNINLELYKPFFLKNVACSFGYVGNSREHFIISKAKNPANLETFLASNYILNKKIKSNLSLFCKLYVTIQALLYAQYKLFLINEKNTTLYKKDIDLLNYKLIKPLLQKFWYLTQ